MVLPLYNLAVRAYVLLIKIAALKDKKAAQWVAGRKNWKQLMAAQSASFSGSYTVWVHCASYGEFEQGRPLIEAIRTKHPHYKILLTFFSPSGYEAFKNWTGADFVCYLPQDTKSNARHFLDVFKPQMAIFVKYEFWLNYLFELKQQNIKSYLVSAVFKPHHPFFKWYGGVFRKSLSTFSKLFVQDAESARLLTSIGIHQHEVSGDTRFDRVLQIKKTPFSDEKIEAFKGNDLLIIAGSTWPGDEDLVLEAFKNLKNKSVKLLIAPHEVNERQQQLTIKKLEALQLTYTLYTQNITASAQVLILNTIGVLAKSYKYAHCVYVGGGFNGGLHNVLEPAVFEKPVSFYAKDYEKFNEAMELIELKVASKVLTPNELTFVFEDLLFNEDLKKQVTKKLNDYFKEKGNATQRILAELATEHSIHHQLE